MKNLIAANRISIYIISNIFLILISISYSIEQCSAAEVEIFNHRPTYEDRNIKIKLPSPELIFESGFEVFPEADFDLDSLEPPAGVWSVSEQSSFEVQIRFKFPIRASLSNTKVMVDGQDVSSSCIFDFYGFLNAQVIRCATGIFDSVGVHNFNVTVGASTKSWVTTSVSTPVFTSFKPAFQFFAPAVPITIEADFFDPNYNIEPNSILLVINGIEIIAPPPVVTMLTPRSGKMRYILKSLPPGKYNISVFIRNIGGAETKTGGGIVIRKPSITAVSFLSPAENAISTTSEVLVRISASSNISDVKTVFINGEKASVTDHQQLSYERSVSLEEGDNTITARVIFRDNDEKTVTRTVRYNLQPQVIITEPRDFQIFGPTAAVPAGNSRNLTGAVERPILIKGIINKPVTKVLINQQLATIDPGGRGFRFDGFFLHEGTNLVTVTAVDNDALETSTNLSLFVDQTAPFLTVSTPSNDEVTSSNYVTVTGVVNDAVEAAASAPEVIVFVKNVANAETIQASVSDKHFAAINVHLEAGANVLEISGTDANGNTRSKSIRVTRTLVGSKRVTVASGADQSGMVKTELQRPLVVGAYDTLGLALANIPIQFQVTQGSGTLSNQKGQPFKPDGVNNARYLVQNTDSAGFARVWLTLGEQPGTAIDVVTAANVSIAERAIFTATAIRGKPFRIVASGASGNQFAEINSQPTEPIAALVLDKHFNPVPGAQVSFIIRSGDASFANGNDASGHYHRDITVTADKSGLATVRPLLGSTPGTVELLATTHSAGAIEAGPEIFQVMVLERKSGPTKFSGVVLDHQGKPLSGVRLSIGRTNLSVTTNTNGVFRFASSVPTGKIDLFVDGRTIQTTNGVQYPALHFETPIIMGQDNQLPHPIYLPPINPAQAKIVGGTEDVVLSIPGFEGFEMLVRANSVTFPDGSHVGPLVVSPVHSDRLPMVPPGPSGSFGVLAWTIQPTGTRFDPPIAFKIPNSTGLRPGRTLEIYQWDHDLAMFVPIGRGSVNEGGTQIVSEPDSGISKAGWGGGPPPVPPTCGENPPPACRGNSCSTCSSDCSENTAPTGACPQPVQACIVKLSAIGMKCENNACKQCQGGRCAQLHSEVVPPSARANVVPAIPQLIPGGLTTYGFTSFDNKHVNYKAIYDGTIKPYCDARGNWKFSVDKLEVTPQIITDMSRANELTDAIINRIANQPRVAACRDLKNADYSLRRTSASHYPTQDNAQLAALRSPPINASNFLPSIISYVPQNAWTRVESIEAHEQIHFNEGSRLVELNMTSFFDEVDSIKTPIINGDVLATVSPRVMGQLDLALDNLSNSIVTDLDGDHERRPGVFYNASIAALNQTFKRIRDYRCAKNCPGSCALLDITPPVIDFGQQYIQNSNFQFIGDPLTITLSNDNNQPITVASMTAVADPFSLNAAGSSCGAKAPFKIAAQTNCTLSYLFNPAAVGPFMQAIDLHESTGSLGSFKMEGFGNGIKISPNSIIFNGQRINSTSNPRNLTITNLDAASTQSITLQAAPLPYAISANNCGGLSFTLLGTSSCTIAYNFTPTQAQGYGILLEVTTSEGMKKIELYGEGKLLGLLTVVPTSMNLTAQVGNASQPSVATLSNTGSAPLKVQLSPLSAPFSISGGTCGTTIPINLTTGQSCTIAVTFSPASIGSVSQALAVTSDGDGGGIITLSGNGLAR